MCIDIIWRRVYFDNKSSGIPIQRKNELFSDKEVEQWNKETKAFLKEKEKERQSQLANPK